MYSVSASLFPLVRFVAPRMGLQRWAAACGVVGLVWVSSAHAAEPKPLMTAQPACAAGWDQLLTPAERETQARERGCKATAAKPPRPVLAAQMGVYSITSSRVLPVGPGRWAGPVPLGAGANAKGRPWDDSARSPKRNSGPVQVNARGAAGLAPLVDLAAREYDIDPLLLHSIARVESRHQPDAVSHAGARGLMQVILPTARRFGVEGADELHDPQTNLQVSARYLKTLQQRFGNNLELVLAAYNAGEGAVEKHGRRIPPYRETQDYVRKVLAEYTLLRNVSRSQGGVAPTHTTNTTAAKGVL
jgi:lysozyme